MKTLLQKIGILPEPPKGRGKKKKATKGRGKAAKAAPPIWMPSESPLAWRIGTLVIVFAALITGWVSARSALLEYARSTRVATVDPEAVTLIDAPTWMSESIAAPLRDQAAAAIAPDPFDAEGIQRAAQRLNQCAWIKEVHQIRRIETEDGLPGLAIDAEYRTPLVAVRDPRNVNDYYLVDAEGVRLAGPWDEPTVLGQGFAVIEGTESLVPFEGMAWEGESVHAAIELAALLAGESFASEIEAYVVVEAKRFSPPFDLAIITTEKQELFWGAPVGHALVTEFIEDGHKLDNLRVLFRYPERMAQGGVLLLNDRVTVARD